jgi:hypothetical protein
MSRRVFRALGWAALAMTVGSGRPMPAVAQVTEAGLLQELDRLAPLYDEVAREADIADSIRAVEEYSDLFFQVDTTAVGPFYLVTQRDQTDGLLPAARAAWRVYERYIDDRPTVLDGLHVTAAVWDWGRPRTPLLDDADVTVRSYHLSAERTRLFGVHLSRILSNALPEDHRALLGDVRLHGDREQRLAFVYRELVVSKEAVAQGCFQGELADCRRGLGLQDEDIWWKSWYTPGRLRMRLQGQLQTLSTGSGERSETAAACWDGMSDSACLEYASTWVASPAGLAPFRQGARESFVQYALRQGGDGSYQDLLTLTSGPILERLAQVAGTSDSALISGWRDEVLSHRPNVTEGSTATRWATVSWIVLLLAFSMRSTRWRLG